MLKGRRSGELCADRLAHGGLRAVAAHEKIAGNRNAGTAIEIARNRVNAAIVLGKAVKFGAVQNGDARLRERMRKKYRLEESLIDPMRRLGRRPIRIRTLRCAKPFGARRMERAIARFR